MSSISRVLTALLMLLFAAGPLSAAAATPALVAQTHLTASVSGTVNDTTGAPVSGASVMLAGPTTASTTTDAAGHYGFASVAPGVYTITASKAGYDSASQPNYGVTAGAVINDLNVTLAAATFSSIREIGRVTVNRARSSFNTGPASTAIVSQQAFVDQGQVSLSRVLDETPGIVTAHPATTADFASPGAIVFPNIRGGLAYETASLIDGHPLAVADFGDYVTTFWTPWVFQSAELIKGPGAMAPQINYAIGGTVNFRTLDPTRKPQGQVLLGYDGFGGQFSNWRYSGTTLNGKLGWVLDYAIQGTPGPLKGQGGYYNLNGNVVTVNGTQYTVSAPTGSSKTPNIWNNPTIATIPLVGCCIPVSTTYTNHNELVKIKYNFSSATSLTASYLGDQAWSDQNGNHASIFGSVFSPSATGGYTGSLAPNTSVPLYQNIFLPANEFEFNNEPIFQAEARTTWGKDTFLARYYGASINRLQYDGGGPLPDPSSPSTINLNVYGTFTGTAANGTKTPITLNGQTVPVTVLSGYFRSSEEDKLHGASFEWDHPIGNHLISAAIDNVSTTDDSYSLFGNSTLTNPTSTPSLSMSVPWGSSERLTTGLLRGIFNLGDKWNVTLSNYFNSYSWKYSSNFSNVLTCTPAGSNNCSYPPYTFNTATYSHYDARIGATYRPNVNASYRVAAGSAIAPPYLLLYDFTATQTPPGPTFSQGCQCYNNNVPSANLQPETSFGYNMGADWRIGGDGQTIISIDGYLTNLHNQYLKSIFGNGTYTGAQGALPLISTTWINISNSRYEGLELSVKRDPVVGFGYSAQGSLLRGYPYNLPSSIYASSTNPYATNLAILPGVNFQTNCQSGTPGTCNALSNQSIPYSQGFGEVHYRSERGGLLEFGETYYGPNNSFNVPAFFVANIAARFPIADNRTFFQVSADNLFNAYAGKFITLYGGIGQPLANGQTGLTNANSMGPTVWRFQLTRDFGQR